MPPNTAKQSGVLFETDEELPVQQVIESKKSDENYKPKLLWLNVTLYTFLHSCALYAIYQMFVSVRFYTIIFDYLMYVLAGIGITSGVHRLWAHRAYKAKWQLTLLLTFFNTLAFEDAIIHWARDHRLHHKYSDTDADPHNATRGVFFSHMGWLLCRKHPLVSIKGRQIDMSDLYADPILVFQKKYYLYLLVPIFFVMPTAIPMYFWGETFLNAFTMNLLRYCGNLHSTWVINSLAHKFGNKPYDKYISPSEHWITAVIALGDGWHNFHHAFPWDYRTGEHGPFSTDYTTGFIDLMAKIGWAYDLRSVTSEIAQKRAKRTGDGSRNKNIWGWGDKNIPSDEVNETVVTYQKSN